MSEIVRARWVLPIAQPPIAGGWVDVAGGRVVGVGGGRAPSGARDLGDVAVLPGLVNAHTHLELSWMAGLVPPAASLTAWIRTLMERRRAGPPGGARDESAAAHEGAAAMARAGTALVGDISNGCQTPAAVRDAGLEGVLFHELIGFREADPVGRATSAAARAAAAVATAGPAGRPAMDASVVAHAPYSVSPRLVQAIAALPGAAPRSIHLAESAEEVEFLQTGRGPMRELLEAIGAWTDEWRVPSTDPVDYVASTGYLRPGTLVVHAVHLADSALARLREAGAIIVTCPRSNAWVGSIPPPVDRFYAAGLPVAVGTDSLASARTLSVWDELAELRRLAPGVPARTLLESATRRGAEALGRAADFGAIAPGRRAVFAVAAVQPDVTDVEECLVTGVELSRVSRLDLV